MPSGTLVLRLDERAQESLVLMHANAAAERLLGGSPRPGQKLAELCPRASSRVVNDCLATLRDGADRELELSGQQGLPSYAARATRLAPGAVALIISSVNTQAEADARRAMRHLDSIIEQVPAMIFMKDAKELRFERFNHAGEELLGLSREALLGKNDYDFFPRDQADFFVANDREVLRSGQLLDIAEEPIQTPRGERFLHTRKIPLLDENGEPSALLGISLDITERVLATSVLRNSLSAQIDETQKARDALALSEEQLRQAQKMEAIGRLAGGIAHDFNNMLSVVLGYCDLAQALVSRDSPLSVMVTEIQKAGLRAAELTRRLLAFSRQQVLMPRVLDLSEVVAAMQGMLERLVSEDISLRVSLAELSERVRADPHQIEQVVMNLVVNARDAMPNGGKLSIQTALIELDDAYCSQHLGARPGPHVMLSVSDTGVGMDAATRQRIFEPFFTTKETGKGTGLGLATVHGIVQQSEGSIWVYSEIGRGTTFKVYLPVIEEREQEAVRVEKSLAPRAGGETILLVEDDEQLRTLTAQILRRHGFQVLEAHHGRHAEEVFAAHAEAVQLLLTDVVMPEQGGRALAESLVARHPGLRVLYMSGYTDDAVVHHGVLEREMNFVQKPFTPAALVGAVRAVLDAAV
jgi:two-component system, cell cycle sensor histidine kinase and response regulator CckA